MKHDNLETYQEMEKRLNRRSNLLIAIALALPLTVILCFPYLHLIIG